MMIDDDKLLPRNFVPLTLRQKAGGELVREQLTWRSQQNLHWRRMAWSGHSS